MKKTMSRMLYVSQHILFLFADYQRSLVRVGQQLNLSFTKILSWVITISMIKRATKG